MKPLKLLACLVTLQLTCCLTLKAADPQPFRQWTDTNGRAITARLVDLPGSDSIKIERQDGVVFTAALALFSLTDQNYVKAVLEAKATGGPVLLDPDAATWAFLDTNHQPASTYNKSGLDLILETANQRFTSYDVKNTTGQTLQVRTDPSDLATRITLSGDMPRMGFGAFLKEIARANKLAIKTDPSGQIVLVDTTIASAPASIEFLGVKVRPKP